MVIWGLVCAFPGQSGVLSSIVPRNIFFLGPLLLLNGTAHLVLLSEGNSYLDTYRGTDIVNKCGHSCLVYD